jgi:WD40 repeat protein
VLAVAFSPDRRLLATGDDRDTTLLWSVADPAHPTEVAVLVPAPNATPAVPPRPPTRSIWAGSDRRGRAVAFSPCARFLATGHRDGTTIVWDVADPGHPAVVAILDRHQRRGGEVKAAAFNSNGRLLATGYGDSAVAIWDTTDPSHTVLLTCLQPRRLGRWGWRSETFALGFHPGGRLLATGGFHGGGYPPARLWDVSNPAHAHRVATLRPAHRGSPFEDPLASVLALAFSPDGRLLATGCDSRATVSSQYGSGQAGYDSMVILWDLHNPTYPARAATLTQRGGYRTGTKRRQRALAATTYAGHTGTVRALDFSPDGKLLATGSDDQTVLLWDTTDPHHPYPTTMLTDSDPVPALAFSPDGRLLATGGRTAQLWELP